MRRNIITLSFVYCFETSKKNKNFFKEISIYLLLFTYCLRAGLGGGVSDRMPDPAEKCDALVSDFLDDDLLDVDSL